MVFDDGTPPEEGLVARWQDFGDQTRILFTGWFRVILYQALTPHRIVIFIREPQYSPRAFRDHLFVTLCKILFTYDRFYIHAGAVDFGGEVSMFVGPGSHGKSTICLRLAGEGATILSEDHVLLRRTGDRFWVSGCQDTARVTSKTERELFDTPLDHVPVDGPGGPKKEFQLAGHFRAAPYIDHLFGPVFFIRVGQRFHIQAITQRDAALRFIYMTRSFYRHNDVEDLDAYLSFFGDLVADHPCHDLELSPDLTALDQLVQFLKH
jgi:hypothetical protein